MMPSKSPPLEADHTVVMAIWFIGRARKEGTALLMNTQLLKIDKGTAWEGMGGKGDECGGKEDKQGEKRGAAHIVVAGLDFLDL